MVGEVCGTVKSIAFTTAKLKSRLHFHFHIAHTKCQVCINGWTDTTRQPLIGKQKTTTKKVDSLTLKMARNIVLDLVVARGTQEERSIHQGELLEHRQCPVAQGTVNHIPLAGAKGRQYKPTGRHGIYSNLYIIYILRNI